MWVSRNSSDRKFSVLFQLRIFFCTRKTRKPEWTEQADDDDDDEKNRPLINFHLLYDQHIFFLQPQWCIIFLFFCCCWNVWCVNCFYKPERTVCNETKNFARRFVQIGWFYIRRDRRKFLWLFMRLDSSTKSRWKWNNRKYKAHNINYSVAFEKVFFGIFFFLFCFGCLFFSVIFSLSEIFSVLYIFYFLVVPVTLVNEMCVENDFVSFWFSAFRWYSGVYVWRYNRKSLWLVVWLF